MNNSKWILDARLNGHLRNDHLRTLLRDGELDVTSDFHGWSLPCGNVYLGNAQDFSHARPKDVDGEADLNPPSPRWRSWLEQLGVMRHKLTDAGCGPSCDRLDIVGETIITVGGVEARHGQQVLENMVRQIAAAKLLVSPLL